MASAPTPPAGYLVELTPAAQRDMKLIPAGAARTILNKIDALATNPRPHGAEKLTNEGGIHRIRSGDYRIILYAIDDASRKVVVTRVRHRRDVYRKKK